MLCTATQRPLTTVYVLTYRRQEEKAGRQRLAAALATGPGAFRDYLGSLSGNTSVSAARNTPSTRRGETLKQQKSATPALRQREWDSMLLWSRPMWIFRTRKGVRF